MPRPFQIDVYGFKVALAANNREMGLVEFLPEDLDKYT